MPLMDRSPAADLDAACVALRYALAALGRDPLVANETNQILRLYATLRARQREAA